MKDLHEIVMNYPTKHKEGFTNSEILKLLDQFPNIDIEKFEDATRCLTCIKKDGEYVFYHCDVLTGLRCGIEKRGMRASEFD